MRNIFIMAFVFIMGASSANAHHEKIVSCKAAKKFLKSSKSQLEALFNAPAEGHLKTLQDLGKYKLEMLQKLVNSSTPYCPACAKVARKLNKLAIKVAFERAKIEKSAEASEGDSALVPIPGIPSTLLPAEEPMKPSTLLPAEANK